MLKKLIGFIVILTFMCSGAFAENIHVEAEWAYNGMNTEGGFKVQQSNPGTSIWFDVVDLPDVTIREHSWDMESKVGRTLFRIMAYSPDNTTFSNEGAFEYIETPGMPSPTVLIRFH